MAGIHRRQAAWQVTVSPVTERYMKTVSAPAWADATVAAGSTYVYSVQAFDHAGNVSAASGSFTVKLAGAGKGK